jgi:glutamate 5-kinase
MSIELTPKDIINTAKRLVIKIGTNSIIDIENWVPKRLWLRDSLKSYASLNRQFGIVSSGAIGMARIAMNGKSPSSLEERQAYAAKGQPSLFNMYRQELVRLGFESAQVLLTKHDLTIEPYLTNTRNTLSAIRKTDTVYVANENDTVATDEIKIGDNDNLAALTAIADDADTLILITDVDGLYTSNPKTDIHARHIQVVQALTPSIFALAGGTNGNHGTGGMITKLEAAYLAAAHGINTIIINGKKPTCLRDLFNGDYSHATFIPYTAHPQVELFLD